MPPSLRRRGQAVPQSPQFEDDSPVPSSDEEPEVIETGSIEDDLEDLARAEEAMNADDEDDEPLGSPLPTDPLHPTYPIPPNFREISTLASWTVSSSKPGCSIPQLRSPSTSLFWQSDGPQPHWLNIHFFKLVRIVGLRLYLDFEADESYTPTRIVFLAGSGGNDLVEWGEMRLEQPRGWIWADFSGVGDVDDDDDASESEDEEEGAQDPAVRGLIAALTSNGRGAADGADAENTEPAPASGDPMLVDTNTSPHPPQPQTHTHTPTLPQNSTAVSTTTSPLPRTHPRRPLHALHPPSPPLPLKPKKPKTPTLRAHLVQIRILENHQNGKDTHLRGLQIFAKDDERVKGVRAPRRSVVPVMGGMGIGGGGGEGKREKGGLGGVRGLAKSEWDVDVSIR